MQTMGAVRVKEDGALQRAGQGQAPCGYGALMTRLPGNGRLGGVLTCLPEVRGRVADNVPFSALTVINILPILFHLVSPRFFFF